MRASKRYVTNRIWLDVRKAQDSKQEVDSRPDLPYGAAAYNFLKQTPASTVYAAGPVMPATDGQFVAMPARAEH